MSAAAVIGREEPSTPFKFLNYYEEADAGRFAGREREIVEISDAIAHAPTLIVYGKSGLGKTSLFLAGVFPELIQRNCLPVHVRTLQNPMVDVLRAVTAMLGPSPAPATAPTSGLVPQLLEALRQLSAERPVVLVLDQFEEFFIRFRGRRDVYEAFIGAVGAIAAERSLRVHVVFSLREEYLADLDDFRSYVPSLFENEYRLRPMTAFGVRQAITRPLEVAGIPFDARLVSRLVDRLARDRFDSVVLQILCQEVFAHALNRRTGALRLTEDDLQDAGDIDGIFRRYLDEMAEELPSAQHLHARVVLRLLTTQERTKQALRVQDFTTGLYRLSEAEALTVLEVIKRNRLLRVDTRGGETWYELTHERLVKILEEWLRLDPQFNALLAAHDWIATPSSSNIWREAPQNLLAPGHLTDVVGPFRARLALSATEIEFVVWSALYHRHEDVAFWAEQLGVEQARSLIREKLTDPLEDFRQGAAFSAALVSGGDPTTLEALVEVSLSDELEEVRREAGLALAQIGTADTNARLRQALKDPKVRPRALQTLADLCRHGTKLEGFSRWQRFRARRIAKKRALDEARTLINDATREGTLGGLFGAGAWTLSAALVYGILLSFVIGGLAGESKFLWFMLCLGAALLGSIGIGALLSVFVSRALASRAVLVNDDNFANALWRSKAFLALPTLLTLLVTCLLYKDSSLGRTTPLPVCLTLLGLPSGYWLLVPLWVRAAQRTVYSSDGIWRRVQAAVFAAAGPAVVLPGVAFIGASRLATLDGADAWELTAAISLFAIPLGSGLTACLALSSLRMWMLQGKQLCPTRIASAPSAALRALLPLLALVGPVLAVGHLGLEVIPFRPSSAVVSAGQDAAIIFPRSERSGRLFSTPRYRRFEVDAGEDAGAILLPTASDDCYEKVLLDGQRLNKSDPLAILHGTHELALTSSGRGGTTNDCKLQLHFSGPVANPEAEIGSKPGRSGSYFWAHWKFESSEETEVTRFKNHFRADVAGVAKPREVVVLELYEPLVIMPTLFGQEAAIAYCGNSGRSRSLTAVEHHTAWTQLKLDEGRTTCVTRADENGSWTVSLYMNSASYNALQAHQPQNRYLSLVRWTQVEKGAAGTTDDEDLPPVDAAFLDLSETSLVGARLSDAILTRTRLSGADLAGADLHGADASFVNLSDAKLNGALLERAHLDFANLRGATIGGARFNYASLRGASVVDVQGGKNGASIDLTGADLERATLTGLPSDVKVDLSLARLVGTSMQGLDVASVDFTGAELLDADLTGARLARATGFTQDQLSAACGEGEVEVPWGKQRLRACPVANRSLVLPKSIGLCTSAPVSNGSRPDPGCVDIAGSKVEGDFLTWNDSNCRCRFDVRFKDVLLNGMLY